MRDPAFIAVHELLTGWLTRSKTIPRRLRNARLRSATRRKARCRSRLSVHSWCPTPWKSPTSKEHIFTLSASLATFGESARQAIGEAAAYGDADTSDLFTEISRGIDHQLWFVESHLTPK
jgi:starvation-inducible DNA-binding protein